MDETALKENVEEATDISLEDMFTEIEKIIKDLEDRDISIEKAIGRYEEGMKLLARCNDRIDGIEKKVMVLSKDGTADEFKE